MSNQPVSEFKTKCVQCGKPMNPVEVMLGPTCGRCCDRNFEAATWIPARRARTSIKIKVPPPPRDLSGPTAKKSR